MNIFRNRLLSIFLSFLMLFSMPTFAAENGVAVPNPHAANELAEALAVLGGLVVALGIVGTIAGGSELNRLGRDWEVPYCDKSSGCPYLITQNTYPSCPNCAVHWENNCHNETNCYTSEQVCANVDGSKTEQPMYGTNVGYPLIIIFSGALLSGFGLCYGSYHVFNKASRALRLQAQPLQQALVQVQH